MVDEVVVVRFEASLRGDDVNDEGVACNAEELNRGAQDGR